MNNSKILKIIFGILLGCVGIFLTFLILVFAVVIGNPLNIIKHDSDLQKFAEEFNQIPLPILTQQIGQTHKEFGLMANGNHCDYYVSKLIESELTQMELQRYFSEFNLPAINPKGLMQYTEGVRGDSPNRVYVSQPWSLPITFGQYFKGTDADKAQKEAELQKEKREELAKAHDVNESEITDKVFLVSSSDDGYKADDIRCR